MRTPQPITTALAVAGVIATLVTFGPRQAAASSEGECADPQQARSTTVWRAFEGVLLEDYFQSGNLQPSLMSPEDWAVILGHALGRQAPVLGGSPEGRDAFDCLEIGVRQAVADSFILPPDQNMMDALGRLIRDSAVGLNNAHVEELTGVPANTLLGTVVFTGPVSSGVERAPRRIPDLSEDLADLFDSGRLDPGRVAVIPDTIRMCETSTLGTYCGTWTWNGQGYDARWDNGATATLELEVINAIRIVVTRSDTAGPSKGLRARYEGRIVGQHVEEGTASWTLSRWDPPTRTGTWTARW